MKLEIWDTPGLEEYRSMNTNILSNTRVVLIVCSFDEVSPWKSIDYHLSSVKKFADDPIIIIVVNKSDLENERSFTYDDFCEKAADLGVENVYKISCNHRNSSV